MAGFALTALPNQVAGLGASTAELGAYAAAIGLPWVLQPLWGPVVDRFGGMRMGRRRFWVLAALAGSLIALSCLLWLGDARPGGLSAIAAVFMAHSLFAALMDTAIDAMIIDHSREDQLGAATACTRAGFVTGLAAGAGIFAFLLPAVGLARCGAILLGLGALAAILPLMVRESAGDARFSLRHGPHAASVRLVSLLAELARSVATPASLALLLFCVMQDFFGALFRLPLGVHLIQKSGWAAESLSTAQAAVGLASGTVGAWLVGRWTDRVGPARSLTWLLGAAALAHLLAGVLVELGGAWAGPLAMSLPSITSALCFVALAPAVMRASRGAVAASRFALYMAALNLGDVLGSGSAGFVMQTGLGPGLAILGMVAAAGYAALSLCAATLVNGLSPMHESCGDRAK